MKPATQSKTIWAGVAATVLSILALAAEFWALLSYEQVELMNQYFGPELVAVIGVIMIALRVVTTSGVVWGAVADEEPVEEDPDEEDEEMTQ